MQGKLWHSTGFCGWWRVAIPQLSTLVIRGLTNASGVATQHVTPGQCAYCGQCW